MYEAAFSSVHLDRQLRSVFRTALDWAIRMLPALGSGGLAWRGSARRQESRPKVAARWSKRSYHDGTLASIPAPHPLAPAWGLPARATLHARRQSAPRPSVGDRIYGSCEVGIAPVGESRPDRSARVPGQWTPDRGSVRAELRSQPAARHAATASFGRPRGRGRWLPRAPAPPKMVSGPVPKRA